MARYTVEIPAEGHSSWIWAEEHHVPLEYFYPAVMPHTARPLSGDNNLRINQTWWDATRARNSSLAWEKLRRNNAGWINWAANKDWGQGEVVPSDTALLPVIEGVTTIGNEVEVLEIRNGRARIQTFSPNETPYGNHQTHPHLWHRFYSINRLRQTGNAPNGVLSYIPLIAKGEAWMRLADLKLKEEKPEMGIPIDWAQGPDMSRYDFSYDKAKAKRHTEFGIQRVSFADAVRVAKDPKLEELYNGLLAVPRRGGYHFWSGFQDPQEQLDTYLEGIDGKTYHFHSSDWEEKNSRGEVVNPFTPKSANDMYYKFMEPLKRITGKRVLLYCQRSDFAQLRDGFKVEWLGEIDIWPKYWVWKNFTSTFDPVKTVEKYWGTGYDKWILQYGGDAWNTWGWDAAKDWGLGFGAVPERRHCDVNLFPGNAAEMDDWLSIDVPQPPEPPTSPIKTVTLKSGETLLVKAE